LRSVREILVVMFVFITTIHLLLIHFVSTTHYNMFLLTALHRANWCIKAPDSTSGNSW